MERKGLFSLKIAVFVSGSGSNLQAIINACDSGEIDGKVAFVLSSKADVYALERATNAGIKTFVSKNMDEIRDLLIENKIDLIVLAGYLAILPSNITESFSGNIINIHPSLIPKYSGKGYYGLKVHEAVIEAGESETGATVHYVDHGVDSGQIILQEKLPVLKTDTAINLQKRVLEIEHKILVKAIAKHIEKKREGSKNNESIN